MDLFHCSRRTYTVIKWIAFDHVEDVAFYSLPSARRLRKLKLAEMTSQLVGLRASRMLIQLISNWSSNASELVGEMVFPCKIVKMSPKGNFV